MATIKDINKSAYVIANQAYEQGVGRTGLQAIDTASLVSMGNEVLSSSTNTESFVNSLMLGVMNTFTSYRPYTGTFMDLSFDMGEWGQVVRKIDGEVPDFVQDEIYNLEDGKSVDMYVVRKPTARQKLFIKRSPYTNFMTQQRKDLKRAFTSESDFMSVVEMWNGMFRTRQTVTYENLGRLAVANYIANADDKQIVHLLTNYKSESGIELTGDRALLDDKFLAYAVSEMMLYSSRITGLSVSYNAESLQRHTPRRDQKFLIYDKFQNRLQTMLQYQAFHDDLVRLREFIEVPYWQAEEDRTTIKVTIDDNGAQTEKTVSNIIGMIFDRWAIGTYMSDQDIVTTPINARALYWNVFHHAEQQWFNDMSENGVIFCLD